MIFCGSRSAGTSTTDRMPARAAAAATALARFPVDGQASTLKPSSSAAASEVHACGMPNRSTRRAVRAGLAAFQPEPHRISLVARVGEVDYVDDSKATNPHAAAASLAAYPSVVWVAGGLFRGADEDVDELVSSAAPRLRAVVLLGADRARIRGALARHAPDVPVVEAAGTDTGAMDLVVAAAARMAGPGDTVLLAPAAQSFDMFRDYPARGDAFAAAVRRLAGAS